MNNYNKLAKVTKVNEGTPTPVLVYRHGPIIAVHCLKSRGLSVAAHFSMPSAPSSNTAHIAVMSNSFNDEKLR